MLKQDDFIKAKLVELGWRFSQSYGGGHLAGQLVMHVLANRFRTGWGSWLSILDRVPVFMAEKELPKLEYPSVWEPVFVKLLHVVDGVYDGSTPDLSKGALYWGDLGKIESSWFLEKIVQAKKEDQNGDLVPVHPRVNDMNSLSFWR